MDERANDEGCGLETRRGNCRGASVQTKSPSHLDLGLVLRRTKKKPKSCGLGPACYGVFAATIGPKTESAKLIPGSDLLSHPPARAVPSAVAGLTSVFGMGTGVTLLLWPPGNLVSGISPFAGGASYGEQASYACPAIAPIRARRWNRPRAFCC